MFGGIINCMKGSFTLKSEGRFPERILNIASTSGIYIYNVKRESDSSISFCVSKKGCDKLMKSSIEGLNLCILDSYGLPVFMQRYKKRAFLILLPMFFIITAFLFSLFIWRVEINGGNEILKKRVEKVIRQEGVYIGALKHKADQNNIKRKAILKIDELSWLWVDIKGTTAYVKIKERTMKPSLNEIHEPADVVALHSGVIEKMQVYCGQPLFSEGMTVEKGQILVTGVLRSENENIPTYYHHACADVILRLTEKKTVIIPKKSAKKIPTGNKKSVYGIKFKKNNIKFSLNSGISYNEYDKIKKTVKVPFIPLSFFRTDYNEVNVVMEDTDTSAQLNKLRNSFLEKLGKENMEIVSISEDVSENENNYSVTFIAQCRVRTDKEIPIKGETNGENS